MTTTAQRLAREHGVSVRSVYNAAKFARDVDTIAAVLGTDKRTAIIERAVRLTRPSVSLLAEACQRSESEAWTLWDRACAGERNLVGKRTKRRCCPHCGGDLT